MMGLRCPSFRKSLPSYHPYATPRRRRKSLLGCWYCLLGGSLLVLLHLTCRWVLVDKPAAPAHQPLHARTGSPNLQPALSPQRREPSFKDIVADALSLATCSDRNWRNFNNTTARVRRPLWWMAPFFSGTGYGSEALDFVLAMYRSNRFLPGSIWISQHGDSPKPIESLGLSESDGTDLRELQRSVCPAIHAIVVCHSTATNWHQTITGTGEQACPPNSSYRHSYVIGRTMFETDRLPAVFVEQSKRMNEIWVPTQFARSIFIRSGLAPSQIRVVGEPINTTFFDPGAYNPIGLPFGQLILGTPKSLPPADEQQLDAAGSASATATPSKPRPFIFLTNFKFEPRKGWDVLLAAYLSAFQASDDVELYIITKPFLQNVNMNEFVKLTALAIMNKIHGEGKYNLSSMPTVYLDTSYIPQDVLPRYYRAADAFVLPSRGEGWGRPHVEAMSMGLPLLATNWSGPTEFLDASVGYPIQVEEMVDADPSNGELFRGHKWAQPSVRHLTQLLRHVYGNPEEAAAKGRAARRRMIERYSPAALVQAVEKQLHRVDRLLGEYADANLAPQLQQQTPEQQVAEMLPPGTPAAKFPWKIKNAT